jgi:hypothetical protein
MLHLTVCYLNATINRKTLKADPEIGTDKSRQTWQKLLVEFSGNGFPLPKYCIVGFSLGLQPNCTLLAVRIPTTGRLPDPAADTCWNKMLPLAEYAYKLSTHSFTNSIPFKFDLGNTLAIPVDVLVGQCKHNSLRSQGVAVLVER